MIARVIVDPVMRAEAERLAHHLPILNDSITKGEGAAAGYVGELVFAALHGGDRVDSYDYDVVLGDGQTVDVKTKVTGVEPEYHYECSVSAANTFQGCDYYGFMRVDRALEVAWWLGGIYREDFYRRARYVPAGTREANGWVASGSCYSVSVDALYPIPRVNNLPGPKYTVN